MSSTTRWFVSIRFLDKKLPHTFNSSFHYIDDNLALNNARVESLIICISSIKKLEVKDIYASYHDLYIEIDNGGRLKQNSTTNVMASLFQWSTSHSSVAIFQQHWCKELHFTNQTLFYVFGSVQSSAVVIKARLHCSYRLKSSLQIIYEISICSFTYFFYHSSITYYSRTAESTVVFTWCCSYTFLCCIFALFFLCLLCVLCQMSN